LFAGQIKREAKVGGGQMRRLTADDIDNGEWLNVFSVICLLPEPPE
jgi:hypothetical protein